MDDDLRERFPTAGLAEEPGRRPRWRVVGRMVGVGLLAAVVVAAVLGVLGPRSTTKDVKAVAGTMSVQHDSIIRPGMDSSVTVTLTPSAAPDTYRLVIAQTTLDRLGIDEIYPQPAAQLSRGTDVVLQFPAPQAGDSFQVMLTGRIATRQRPTVLRWSLGWLTSTGTVGVEARTVVTP